jgi:dihydrofolate reductase
MSSIVVINHLTLDGVMQGPGRADEDTRGGFNHGGWSLPYGDDVVGQALGARMGRSGGLLFGRRTYLDLLSHWNSVTDSPFTDALNAATKYIASTTLTEPLPWPNSVLLGSDVPGAVKQLKEDGPDDEIHVMGSGELIQTLRDHHLVDEYLLLIHPLVLGSGHRLFSDGSRQETLRLVDSLVTGTGVHIATYRPA